MNGEALAFPIRLSHVAERAANVVPKWAAVLLVVCGSGDVSDPRVEKDRHYSRSSESRMPNCDEVGKRVRILERARRMRGGITVGRYYDVTDRWIREFFENPKSHLKTLIGVDVDICSSSNKGKCLNAANEVLKERKRDWRQSSDRGKILVGLTYVLGLSILEDRRELDWVLVLEEGFVDDIGIGDGDAMLGLFSKLASIDVTFVLGEDGIDLLTWKLLLESESPSRIDGINPMMTLITKDEG